jgi:hypothetical protein
MPITRNEWVLYWTFWAVAPAIGWALFGKDGAVTYGIVAVAAGITGAIVLWKRSRPRGL